MATVSSCTLSPTYFTKAWQQLTDEHFDMIIIGGGSVGAGTALDAATRGLKVALIEARDFAAGTSPRSSKMFHGGLRYLARLPPCCRITTRTRTVHVRTRPTPSQTP